MTIPASERIAIVTITRPGLGVALKIQGRVAADLYVSERYVDPADTRMISFDGIVKNLLPGLFERYDGIVLVMALGIVVRTIAPLIQDKKHDPGIVVVDVSGRFAISVLSGHLGGANQLARDVAEPIGATPVITTGTDATGTIAPDLMSKEIGADLEPFDLLKRVSSAIVDGDKVLILNPERIPFPSLQGPMKPHILVHDRWPDPVPQTRAAVVISNRTDRPTQTLPVHVTIYPRTLAVGIGCNRGTAFEEIRDLVLDEFRKNHLATSSIRKFRTIDLKSDEAGIIETARHFDRALATFTREELSAVPVPTPSQAVLDHVGTPGVAEPAAVLVLKKDPPFAGGQVRIVITKTKSLNATLSVSEWIPDSPDSSSRTDNT